MYIQVNKYEKHKFHHPDIHLDFKSFNPKYNPHCYSIRSNLKKMGPLQFCLPVFLGIHRNPIQKEFFHSCEGFFR